MTECVQEIRKGSRGDGELPADQSERLLLPLLLPSSLSLANRGERGKEESARKKDRDPSARAVQPLFDTRNMDTRGGFRTLKA